MADFTLGHVPPDIIAAWILLTGAMIGYWYFRFRQAGVLTFDVFFIGLYLYVPIVFMSLFAYSPLNSAATGDWHWRYLPYIREAYYVSLLGVVVFAAVVFVLANLLVDLIYPLLDPRIRVGRSRRTPRRIIPKTELTGARP
jgi:hypothetical protein